MCTVCFTWSLVCWAAEVSFAEAVSAAAFTYAARDLRHSTLHVGATQPCNTWLRPSAYKQMLYQMHSGFRMVPATKDGCLFGITNNPTLRQIGNSAELKLLIATITHHQALWLAQGARTHSPAQPRHQPQPQESLEQMILRLLWQLGQCQHCP